MPLRISRLNVENSQLFLEVCSPEARKTARTEKVRAAVEVLNVDSYLGKEGASVSEDIADEPSEEGS